MITCFQIGTHGPGHPRSTTPRVAPITGIPSAQMASVTSGTYATLPSRTAGGLKIANWHPSSHHLPSAPRLNHTSKHQEKSPKRKTVDNIPAWIEDLEYVIDKYGTHPNYHFMLLHILLGRSKRVDIIEMLYLEVYPQKENFNFRRSALFFNVFSFNVLLFNIAC